MNKILLISIFISSTGCSWANLLYESNFSGLALDTPLVKADNWWSNGWGSTVDTRITESGPGGTLAVTRTTTGNVYGGVLRAFTEGFAEPLPTGASNMDVTVSLWVKGTSTDTFGPMGFTLIGFTNGTEGFDKAGQSSYFSIPVTSEWMQHSFTLDDMVVTPGREDALLDITTVDALQVFPHFRADIETGWPIGDENAEWSVSMTGLSITAVPEPSTYAAIIGLFMLGFAIMRRRR